MQVIASKMNREKKTPTKGSCSFLKLMQFGIPLTGLCFITEVISGDHLKEPLHIFRGTTLT